MSDRGAGPGGVGGAAPAGAGRRAESGGGPGAVQCPAHPSPSLRVPSRDVGLDDVAPCSLGGAQGLPLQCLWALEVKESGMQWEGGPQR